MARRTRHATYWTSKPILYITCFQLRQKHYIPPAYLTRRNEAYSDRLAGIFTRFRVPMTDGGMQWIYVCKYIPDAGFCHSFCRRANIEAQAYAPSRFPDIQY